MGYQVWVPSSVQGFFCLGVRVPRLDKWKGVCLELCKSCIDWYVEVGSGLTSCHKILHVLLAASPHNIFHQNLCPLCMSPCMGMVYVTITPSYVLKLLHKRSESSSVPWKILQTCCKTCSDFPYLGWLMFLGLHTKGHEWWSFGIYFCPTPVWRTFPSLWERSPYG